MSLLDALITKLQEFHSRPDFTKMNFVRFTRDILNVKLWEKQKLIGRLSEEGHRYINVYTGHGIGKTFLSGCLTCYWLAKYGNGTRVITSAPTFRQVEQLLWKEINKLWRRSEILMSMGKPLTTKLELDIDWFASGFSTDDPNKFQGIHCAHLFFIIDEANGFPSKIYEAIDSCMTGENCQCVSIGNPVVPVGRFYEDRNKEEVKKVVISSREHPNVVTGRNLIPGAVTRTWVKTFEARYKSSPEIIASRIDALFPETGANAVFTRKLFEQAKKVVTKTTAPCVFGLDVARYGENLSVLTGFQGQKFLGQWYWGKSSITTTVSKTLDVLSSYNGVMIVVDDDGVGGGVTDLLADNNMLIYPFRSGGKYDDRLENENSSINPPKFGNNITAAYYLTKESMEAEILEIQEHEAYDTLITQCTSRQYYANSRGTLFLESKDEYEDRTGFSSPDFADSFCMCVFGLLLRWQTAVLESI